MIRIAGATGRRRRVADQVTHDKRIQYHEYHKWRDEEEQHQQQEERHAGDRVGLRQAHRHAIHLIRHLLISLDVSNDIVRDALTRHPHFAILRYPDHRTAINWKKETKTYFISSRTYLLLLRRDFDEITVASGQKKEAAKRDGVYSIFDYFAVQ